jgi:hypothetical protein
MDIEQGNLYKVQYESKGYMYEEFVYKEELIDELERINERGSLVSILVVEA